MRLFGWFRFPQAVRAPLPCRRKRIGRRAGAGWQPPGWQLPAVESLETRRLLAAALSVSNPVPLQEGDNGTSNMVFVVTRSGDTTPEIKVNYTTRDGTAKAGVDYMARSGMLDFQSGITALTVAVSVIGNSIFQSNRTFSLQLANPSEQPGLPTFAAAKSFSTGSYPDSVTAADINGDGLKDLIVANNHSVSVLLNTTVPGSSAPGFAAQQTFAAGNDIGSVTVADLNGDGRQDLIVNNPLSNTVSVLMNESLPGAGVLKFTAPQTISAGVEPGPAIVADMNGDGRVDLIVPDINVNSVSVLLNTTIAGATQAAFALPQTFAAGAGPVRVTASDLNGDGQMDLIATNNGDGTVSVLMNATAPGASQLKFASRQTFAVGPHPFGVTAADLNGDGRADLVVANNNSQGSISVLLNETSPGATVPLFAPQQTFAAGSNCDSVTAVDLNGDGKLDILASNFNNPAAMVLVNATKPGATTVSFVPAPSLTEGGDSECATAADLNGDGASDLITADLYSGTVSVLFNTTALPQSTTVEYDQPATFATGAAPSAVQAVDINGDGLKDLVVANAQSMSVSVLLNTTAPGATLPSFANQQTFAVGNLPNSVIAADVNGDGRMDLITTNLESDTVSVLLNAIVPGATAASFEVQQTFAVGAKPEPAAIADIDGDGRPDVIVPCYGSNSVSVLLNATTVGATQAAFTQQTFATGAGPRHATVADINGDGRKDMIVTNYEANTVSVLLNVTTPGAAVPRFAAQETFAVGAAPRGVAAADLNGDGRTDLVVADYGQNTISVLLNTTSAGATIPSFAAQQTFAAGQAPASAAAIDLNGDGKLDILITNYASQTTSVLLNVTKPGATSVAFAPTTPLAGVGASLDATAADLNGDGQNDLVVTNSNSGTVSVLLNAAAAMPSPTVDYPQSATFAAGATPINLTVADVNGDGRKDLIDVNFQSNTLSVLLNTTGAGTTAPSFAAPQTFATGAGPHTVTVADINGDGRQDLVVANLYSNSVSVLLNTTASGATVPSYVAQQTFATGAGARFVTAADINGDGILDLIVDNQSSNSVSVLLNTTVPGSTAASFAAQQTFAVGSQPLGAAVTDLNGDGLLDLVINNYGSNSISVLMNTTRAGATIPSFAPQQTFATGVSPWSVAAVDINGDGHDDVVVTNYDQNGPGSISVLLNTTQPGTTTPGFAPQQTFASGTHPVSVQAVDLNGDGKLDLLVSNYNSSGASVLLNATAPGSTIVSLTAVKGLQTGKTSTSAIAADLNGDGAPDVVVTNYGSGTVSVLPGIVRPLAISDSTATGTILDDDVPATIDPVAGTPQSALVNSPFSTNLAVLVKNAAGNPISNVSVWFSASANGAGGMFASNPYRAAVTTNASGIAVAPTLTANGTAGSYPLRAIAVSGAGSNHPFTVFALTNTAATPAPQFGSAVQAIFAAGLAGSFTVTATGSPAPALTEDNTDVLPSGVKFNPSTGVLSGTPAPNSTGDYILHFSARNSVSTVQQTFTLKVTAPFLFAGKYAVFSGYGSPRLASITQNGAALTLNGDSTAAASISDATQILVNGTDTAIYGNGSIELLAGTFAGQTWTKLDLPTDFTNPAGARVHITQNGNAVSFTDRNGTQSAGTWIDTTQLSAYGETVTVGSGASSGQLLWSDGTIWSEVVLLSGTSTGATVTIAAVPSHVLVTDYLTGSGFTVHTVQTGTKNIVFVDRLGNMVLGTYSPNTTNVPQATAPSYPGYTASIVGNTITFTDGNPADTVVWTKTSSPATTLTTSDYTNQNGVPVHLVQNGTKTFVIVDGLGNTSLGHFLTATTGVADSYPTDIATFTGNIQNGTSVLTWSDGIFVWTQTANPPLLITAGDQNRMNSHLAFQGVGILIGLDGPLKGVTGVRVDDEIEWSNGAVWANLGYDALGALFGLGTGFP
jgi:hypothetical protein